MPSLRIPATALILLLAGMALPPANAQVPASPPATQTVAPVSEQKAYAIGLDAYVYFYPMITMDVTRRQANNYARMGEVYNFPDLARFPGASAQARYGYAFGNRGGGELWLQNDVGVIMYLNARREGLMLSLGGDGMVVSMR